MTRAQTNMKEQQEEFHRICGGILRIAISVEMSIDFWIESYILSREFAGVMYDERGQILKEEFLNRIFIGRKIEILKEIMKKEDIYNDRMQKLIKNLKGIFELRNKVAHDEGYYIVEKGFGLQTKKVMKGPPKFLTEEDLKEAEELAVKIKRDLAKIRDLIIRARKEREIQIA